MTRLLLLCAAVDALRIGGCAPREVLSRRQLLASSAAAALATGGGGGVASARNLPESTGAKGDARGTVAALVPLMKLESSLAAATEAAAARKLDVAAKALAESPADEKAFKRLFDEYSADVSYKQKYMDSNAFVVYYTKGFDGAGRPSIEDDPAAERQTKQYGFRNDAWVGVDDARAELAYLKSEPGESTAELTAMLKRASSALGNYLALAPPDDVSAARAAAGTR